MSGSDDFTLFLWNPAEEKKPVARMTGHQALVNEVLFSPDTRLLASASFDKSVKIWDGRTGKYVIELDTFLIVASGIAVGSMKKNHCDIFTMGIS